MELIGIALMVFSVSLLISVIYYVSSQIRHKEKMSLIDKGLDPSSYQKNTFKEALKYGMALIGAGLGMLTGVILESSGLFPGFIELPLYFAPVMFFVGTTLVLYYRLFHKD